MKTIAVVRLPYYEVSAHKEIREQLESRLSDYHVLLDFSTANEKLTIDFFSPELQQGGNKLSDCIRVSYNQYEANNVNETFKNIIKEMHS